MDKIWLKLFTFTAWIGILFTLAGTALCIRALIPYIGSELRTASIPTAPPMAAAYHIASTPQLLPQPIEENHNASGSHLGMVVPVNPSTDTPTPTLEPTPVPPTFTAIPPTETAIPPTATPILDAKDAKVETLPPTPTPTPIPPTPTPFPPTATPIPSPTPTPTPTPIPGIIPVQLRIPAIDLDAPIIPIGWETVDVGGGNTQATWAVPDWKAVGWHNTSARVGTIGNTVLNGHNTTRGEVFRDLYKLQVGNTILIDGEDGNTYAYKVAYIYILPEAGQPLEVRLANAEYIQPTTDERLTMVTCHPYGSTRFRLLIISYPQDLPSEPIE